MNNDSIKDEFSTKSKDAVKKDAKGLFQSIKYFLIIG